MSDTSIDVRTYRLSPVDRTGWLFGLSLVQLLIAATGVVIGAILMVVASVVVGVLVMAAVVGLGVARLGGQPLVELLPLGLRWAQSTVGSGSTWYSPVPLLRSDTEGSQPPALDGQELLCVDAAQLGHGAPGAKAAVSHDKVAATIAATLRVSGRQFGLLEPTEQDWLLDSWGRALGAFVSERNPVVSIRWSQWAAPAGLDEHRAWLSEQLAIDPLDDVRTAYERLLREAGTQATRHEVLVTVTVAIGRVRRSKNKADDQLQAAVETLLGEVRLFGQRLEGAGLIVSGVLTPPEWARAMRLRLDPSQRSVLDARVRSLGETAGATDPANAGPTATEQTWNAWHTDDSWHRALRVTEWPRIDVQARWLSDLMLYAGCVRTMAVVMEPVPRSRSQRSIVRESAKIESDAAHRAEKGFRVGAHHRRARQAVEEREEELVAGYGEFAYAGIVTVTAATLEDLDDATAEISQVAASLGLEVRPLSGRHDLAVVATLPVARGVVPKDWL